MPNLLEISGEYHAARHRVRLKYLEQLHSLTGRNIIVYYSGWLQKPNAPKAVIALRDIDVHGFMSVINGLDRDEGLDLILHTPGGEVAATEALVNYLRSMFGVNIRVIVPQIALSAGTMIACAAKTILMGKHSSLGPIDPQIMGIAAHGVVREFQRAYEEIKEDPAKIYVWRPIIAQYHPTLVGKCEQAIDWAEELAAKWLETGMLKNDKTKAKKIAGVLANHHKTKSHSRHLSAEFCKKLGLKVEMIEENQELQDAVLSVHHVCILTLMQTSAAKLIMNHKGIDVVENIG